MGIWRIRDRIAARLPMLGAWIFVSAVQYVVIQLAVASRFSPTYSIAHNTISDLGNTSCARWNGRQVCSPAHALMNGSFVLLGVTMILGSALIYPTFNRSRGTRLGFSLFALGGVGVVMVGTFPENTVSTVHGVGAALAFVLGNAGLVLLGCSFRAPTWLRAYTIGSGGVALGALALYASHHYLGLGEGGMERVVAYPQTVWQIALGIFVLSRRRTPLPD